MEIPIVLQRIPVATASQVCGTLSGITTTPRRITQYLTSRFIAHGEGHNAQVLIPVPTPSRLDPSHHPPRGSPICPTCFLRRLAPSTSEVPVPDMPARRGPRGG